MFPGLEVKIIEISDGPIASIDKAKELSSGEIGELIVRGRSVTREYFNRPDATAAAKISDGDTFWHRIGDVGYLDADGLLWFCGRKSHIVETTQGRMFSVRCEAIFNEHPRVYRSALVGLGSKPEQQPCIVIEPEEGHFPTTQEEERMLIDELRTLAHDNALTESIKTILLHRSLPVDTRHNVKINREALAVWARDQ